nr:hypothetical protein [Kibdelosporangium sp. MJ126-NF4]CTQ91544.1 hypothetical protein [Kibdelosporangium sp. MJ126-NF4]
MWRRSTALACADALVDGARHGLPPQASGARGQRRSSGLSTPAQRKRCARHTWIARSLRGPMFSSSQNGSPDAAEEWLAG